MSKKVASPVVAPVALAIVKRDKTVLASGLTYSLCSRVYNALEYETKKKLDADKKAQVEFIDGRGSDKTIHKDVVAIAEKLGAKFIASVRSSFLRPRMQIDWTKLTVEMVELVKPEAKAS